MKKQYKFMTCNWENLIYLNFHIAPNLIANILPKDVELDLFKGKAVLSIVCFEFSKAKLFGLKIPFHQYFPEINIRTYVKRKDDKTVKGIYFLSEMVPKFMTYFTGKFIYGEPFSMRNLTIAKIKTNLKYAIDDSVCKINIEIEKRDILQNQIQTEEQKFVIERNLAFCGKAYQKVKIYKIKHQKWNLIDCKTLNFTIQNVKHLNKIVQNVLLYETPKSVFMTDGSEVEVFKGFFI